MATYVDDMFRHPMGKYRRMKMSHMIATSHEELHAMADTIGVSRRWFQGDHYDIAMVKRVLAIEAGAQEVTMRQLASMCALHRWGAPMGDPGDAVTRMLAFKKASV
jgi:hypothetical protein